MILTHPTGGVHTTGTYEVLDKVSVAEGVDVVVCVAVGVSLCTSEAVGVGVGKLSGSVGRICVGVEGGGSVSASASMIPPTTKMTETIAMMTPIPNWRSDCMISSPYQQPADFWRAEEGH